MSDFCQKHASYDQCGRAAERWLYGDRDSVYDRIHGFAGRYDRKDYRYETRQVDNREEYARDHQADGYLQRDAVAGSLADGVAKGTDCANNRKSCGQ